MATIGLVPYNRLVWVFNGKSVRRPIIVPRANCRPAKEVYDQEISLITSECLSQDQCEPKIKSYHKFAASVNLKETIAGIGLGCDMLSGSISFTRRSENTDAGNSAPFGLIRTAMDGIVTQMMAAGTLSLDKNFGIASRVDKACPEAAIA